MRGIVRWREPISLASEIGGNLAPFLGAPFHDGIGERVCLYPSVGALKDIEQRRIYGIASDVGVGMSPTNPTDSRFAVAVDSEERVRLGEKSESVDDGEVFADIVGATLVGSHLEYLRAGSHRNPLIFHNAGIAHA